MLKRTLAVTLLCCCAWPCSSMATIYKTVDKHGNTNFTDKPSPGASRVKLPPIQTYQASEAPRFKPAKSKAVTKPVAQRYKSVKFLQPSSGQTFRDNQGMVPVSLQLDPPLNFGDGHMIQIKVNGVPVGKPRTATEFTLYNINRGTHNLTADILDAGGKVIAHSDSVVFYMHRTVAQNHKVLPATSLQKPALPLTTPAMPLSKPVT